MSCNFTWGATVMFLMSFTFYVPDDAEVVFFLINSNCPAGVEVSFPCKTVSTCCDVTFCFNWFGSSTIDNSEVDFPKNITLATPSMFSSCGTISFSICFHLLLKTVLFLDSNLGEWNHRSV